ncbi:MAG: hypothetical protein AAF530_24965, partial [Pseudomonadota bacterium]
MTLSPDGQAQWAAKESDPPAFEGTWQCDTSTGTVNITWAQGVTDRLALTDNDNRLEGSNQHGVAVHGVRFVETISTEPPGPVPPGLVGTWLLEILLPSPEGPIPVLWEVRFDGSYNIYAGPYSHSGQMEAYANGWSLDSETNDFQDMGSYRLQNWATLVTHGSQGPGRWHRYEPSLTLQTTDISGQLIPSNLPELVTQVQTPIASWRPDARLIAIDYRRPSASQANVKSKIDLSYASPASGAGLMVSLDTTGARFFVHDVVNWGEGEIPNGFLDLPTVWVMAQQHGLLAPLDRAGLKIWYPQDQDPVLAWTISTARGDTRGINLDAAAGIKLDGDLSGYVAAYNAQWQEAIAGLKRLFRQPRRSSSSSFDFSFDSSDDSTSYDSDSTDSGSDYGVAAQGAWSSGDMGAYDRIMSGTPT